MSVCLPRLARLLIVACALAAVGMTGVPTRAQKPEEQKKPEKPKLTIRAAPPLSFTPAKVRAAVDLTGGDDDYEDFYCVTAEWEWGDGTRSEKTSDCEPYQAGKSEITRRYSAEHTYNFPEDYRIDFRLKRKNRTVASVRTTIKVRQGSAVPFESPGR
jgi:hypothetical protein